MLIPSHAQTFADRWEFIGVAVEDPGYHVWGSSPIIGPDGKVHLFSARWPEKEKVDPGWRSHSEIAHYVADKPEGPFHFSDVALRGTGKETWDKIAVHNPAILQHPDGGFYLYFKSQAGKMGLAIAENFEGPYVQMPYPVTYNEQSVEDGYAFMYEDQFCLLTTDNHGMIKKGGGILWRSDDGIRFTDAEAGFHRISDYLDADKLINKKKHYGGDIVKLERPQVLLIDGKPAYLYATGGWNIYGGNGTVCYVLKY